jgi:hypothetical protein
VCVRERERERVIECVFMCVCVCVCVHPAGCGDEVRCIRVSLQSAQAGRQTDRQVAAVTNTNYPNMFECDATDMYRAPKMKH